MGSQKICEGLSDDEFQKLVEEDDEVPWFCLVFQMKLNAEIFPFGVLSKFKLSDLYGIDLPSHLETLPSFETRSKLENLPHMNDFDIDDNIVNTIFSKYHTLNEISQLNLSRKNFSIFHTNIRSLSKHIDSPSHLKTLPSFETRSKLKNLPHMNDFDIDDNIVNTIFSSITL